MTAICKQKQQAPLPVLCCAILMAGINLHAQSVANLDAPSTTNETASAPSTPVSVPGGVTIHPNGIITLFGESQVLFKTEDPATSQQKSYLLSEKQRRDGIEVVTINASTSVVIFNNHGIKQELRLPKGSIVSYSESSTGTNSFPPEIPRPDGVGGGYPPYLGGDENTGQLTSKKRLTPDQQILMIEAQRAYYRAKGDPDSLRLANALPPTAMTPEDAYDLTPGNATPAPDVQ